MDELVLSLLAGTNPLTAKSFLLSWSERRTSSWIDAARDANARAASGGHLPQIRGQLRYHLGERALGDAAADAGLGCLPLPTRPKGGTFMVARVGRFALINLKLRKSLAIPRRSTTRSLLSQPNQKIDPQTALFDDARFPSGPTQLAYLGCLVAIDCKADPTVPAELALGVLSANMDRWMSWIPLPRACAMLQDISSDAETPIVAEEAKIPDNAFPKLRLPGPGPDPAGRGK